MFQRALPLAIAAALSMGCATVSKTVQPETPPVAETAPAQPANDAELEKELAEIARSLDGRLGVYAVDLKDGRSAGHNANERFAIQSVVKLPIAMAVLKKVEDGELSLDQVITYGEDELVPDRMHSPLRDANPKGGQITVRELIQRSVSESDGTAADVLQRVAGGAEAVQAYVRSLGVGEMDIRLSHKEFARDFKLQYENSATPVAATELLRALDKQATSGSEAAKRNAEFLLETMYGTPTGPNRLKGMLPQGTRVAHKTGTGATRDGVTAATNDVGLITLPDGRQVAIAVFVGDAKGDAAAREAVIARSARAVWDRWSGQPSSPDPQ